MENAFYFMLKALSILEIFKLLPGLFGYVEKWLVKKTKANFKIYDVTGWMTNNDNPHIAQYLKK